MSCHLASAPAPLLTTQCKVLHLPTSRTWLLWGRWAERQIASPTDLLPTPLLTLTFLLSTSSLDNLTYHISMATNTDSQNICHSFYAACHHLVFLYPNIVISYFISMCIILNHVIFFTNHGAKRKKRGRRMEETGTTVWKQVTAMHYNALQKQVRRVHCLFGVRIL